jgi:hypothetical protein
MPADARRAWIEKHKEWFATVPGAKHIVVEKNRTLHSRATAEARDRHNSTDFEPDTISSGHELNDL